MAAKPLKQLGGALVIVFCCISAWAQPVPEPLWSRVVTNYAAQAIALSPDGEVFATGSASSGYEIKLWRTADGSHVTDLGRGIDSVTGLAFSPDGQVLASIGRDEMIRLWSLAEGEEFASLPGAGGRFHLYGRVAFSPDGTLLAGSRKGEESLGIWRVSDQVLLHELAGNEGDVNTVAFSPDGKLVASGGGMRGLDTTAKIWDAATGELIKTIETSNEYNIEFLRFSPDGRVLATGTSHYAVAEGNVELWDTENWQLIHRLPAYGYLLAFSPDGKVLISINWVQRTARNEIAFWNVGTGAHLATFSAAAPAFGMLYGMEVLPDGSGLILVGSGGNSYLNALPMPVLLLASPAEGGMIRFEANAPGGVLQVKTDWNEEWQDVEPISDGITIEPSGQAAFFRVKVVE